MKAYFSGWDNAEGIRRSFEAEEEGFPTDEQILFAAYEGGAWEGDAIVVFEQDGKLYEAHGSHCSCYGLEGQWEPEETTWAALKMRRLSEYSYAPETRAAFKSLVDSREG